MWQNQDKTNVCLTPKVIPLTIVHFFPESYEVIVMESLPNSKAFFDSI